MKTRFHSTHDFLVHDSAWKSINLLLLVLGLCSVCSRLTAQSYLWTGLGADSNFGTGNNWQGGAAPGIGSGVTLYFAGSTQPNPYNNYGNYNDFGSWFLTNDTPTSFIITGNPIGLWSTLENDSTNFFGIGIANIAARAPIQLNPVNGNLTVSNSSLGGAIFLDNNASLTVWGDNVNTSRTLTLDTILSQGNGNGGNGSLVVNQKATVVLLGNNTYDATTINSGTVQVGNGGTSGTLGSGLVSNNVDGGGSVVFNRSDNITVNNQFWASSGTNTTIVQNGSGSVTLGGTADNISCVPVVNAGTLILAKNSSSGVHAVGGVGTINSGGTVKLGGSGGDQIWTGAGFIVNGGGLFDMAGLSEGFDQLSGSGVVSNSVGAASTLTLGENGGGSTFGGTIIDGTTTGAKVALTKAGAGTLILTGANTYSGTTTINAGTLQVGNGSASGAVGTGVITNYAAGGAAIKFNRTDPVTVNNQITSSSQSTPVLYQNGSGTLTLAGAADNISLAPVVNSGTLILGKTSSGIIHAMGGIGTINSGGTVKLGGTGGDQVYTGGGFTVNSGGIFDLAGLNEGFDQLSGSGTVSNSVAATSTLTLGENGGSSSFSGVIRDGTTTGAKIALTKSGAGALTLSGPNAFSGATTLNAGTLNINSPTAIGSGTFTIVGGTIDNTSATVLTLANNNPQSWNGNFTFTGTRDLNLGNGAVTPNAARDITVNAGTLTVGGTISGTQDLYKDGGGTLALTGGSSGTPSSIGQLFARGGTLTISGYFNTANKFIAQGGGTINWSGTGNGNGAFFGIGDGGNGTLNVTGGTLTTAPSSGVFIANGANSVSGTVTVSGGILRVNSNVYVILGSGYNTAGTGTGTLTVSGTGLFDTGTTTGLFQLGNNGGVATVHLNGGTISTLRSISKGTAGTGTSATFNFNGGTLKATGNNSTFMTGLSTANVRNGGAIIDDSGFAVTIAQALVHSTIGGDNPTDGGLTKQGSGTLTLSGPNTFNGGTTIKAGTLTISSDGNIGATSCGLTFAGGSLHSTAIFGLAATRAVNFTGAGSFNVDSTTTLTLNNGFNNAASANTAPMTFNGPGTVVVAGNVSIANDNPINVVNSSTLQIDPGASGTFNTAGKFTIGNGSAGLVNFKSGTANFTANDFFALADGSASAVGTLNVLGGTMNLNLGSGQRLLLGNQGAANINVSAGSLVVGSNPTIELGGDIQYSANNASGTLTVSGTGSVTVNGSGTFELGRNTPGKSGATGTINLFGGTLTTSRNITKADGTGNIKFSGGTLKAAAASSSFLTGLTTATVSTNGAIIDDGGFAITIGQSLLHDATLTAADGGLTKLNTGDLTLAGANTYNGPTAVSAGRLFVTGSLGTNAVTVNNNATLLGTGTINGPISVLPGGTIQPGTATTPTGTLNLTSQLNLRGNAVLSVDRTNSQIASLVLSTTNISYGGTLTVTNLGPDLQSGDTFILFTAASYSNSFASLVLPSLAPNLAWDTTQLTNNGAISVATVASVSVAPVSTNAECASTVTLTATAGGTPPFAYQWFDNQTNPISGATTATLTLNNLHNAQAGNYTVRVVNNVGSATAVAAIAVADTTPPVITLSGSNPMTVECHSAFMDPGGTALDACAGPVAVVATGNVDTNTLGSYTVTYTANDGNGNNAMTTRTVNVVDTTPPTITWSFTNLTLSADNDCQALMPDVTGTNYILASDLCSASVTITQSPTNNTSLALGTNEVVLAVADSSTNISYVTNTIVVADTTPPEIAPLGANPLTNECHSALVDPGATATDNCSGLLTLSTNTTADPDTVGVYTIQYVAQDAAGNLATNTRTVYVVDTTLPVVTVTGDNPITIECHDGFADLGATAHDTCAGDLSVTVSGTVDPNSPGNYTLTYSATDPSGNTGTATRTVNVVDTTPPSITWSFTNLTLNTDGNCQALMPDVTGTNYILASDLCSASVTITQTPTNNASLAVGTNIVLLAVADTSGNTTYVTNTVIVADTTPPEITMLGANPLTNECHADFIDPGATATDNCSGVIILSTNTTADPNTPGIYTINYVANDAAGNSATNTRTVYIVDTTAPAISQCVPGQVLAAGADCTASLPDLTGLLQATDACSSALNVAQFPPAGTILPLGSTNVLFNVDDGNGNTNTCTAVVSVRDQSAPSITSAPQSVTNHVGSSVLFSVEATACTSLSYQWLFNNAQLDSQTDTSLTLPSIGSCDAGKYQVVVTSSGGATTSAVAVLTVINDPTNISPAGALSLGTQDDCSTVILKGGNAYLWELNSATGTPGINSDLLSVTGDIDLQASPETPFTIKIASLTSANVAGAIDGFLDAGRYSWPLVTASGTVLHFDTSAFAVDTTAFSNRFTGTFSVVTNGATLELNYVGPVVPPTLVSGKMLNDGSFQLTFSGPNGQTYKLLTSPDSSLDMSSWEVLTTGTFGSEPITFTDPEAVNSAARFYRLTSP